MDKRLTSEVVINLAQVEVMREILNEALMEDYTQEEYEEWWVSSRDTKAWLFYTKENHHIVGLVTITDKGLFNTPFVAVLPSQRGNGYEEELADFYLDQSLRPLAMIQSKKDEEAYKLSEKNGWRIIGIDDEVEAHVLFHPGRWPKPAHEEIVVFYDALKNYGIPE